MDKDKVQNFKITSLKYSIASKLKTIDILILSSMIGLWSQNNQVGYSYQYLVDFLGKCGFKTSKPSVIRSINRLVNFGLVVVEIKDGRSSKYIAGEWLIEEHPNLFKPDPHQANQSPTPKPSAKKSKAVATTTKAIKPKTEPEVDKIIEAFNSQVAKERDQSSHRKYARQMLKHNNLETILKAIKYAGSGKASKYGIYDKTEIDETGQKVVGKINLELIPRVTTIKYLASRAGREPTINRVLIQGDSALRKYRESQREYRNKRILKINNPLEGL